MNDFFRTVNINKMYDDKVVLKNININLKRGGSFAILGGSGSGKTTLCKIIIGLEKSDSGAVYLEERELKTLRKRTFDNCAEIQYVFQDPYSSLEDSSTVYKTLREPIRACGKHKRNYVDMKEALDLVGLNSEVYLHRIISSLSGGERQRVAIARALITKPSLIIADESTSMLDKASSIDIYKILKKLKRDLNLCVLIITHDLELLRQFGDYVFVIDKGEIVDEGKTEEVLTKPRSGFLVKLLDSYEQLKRGSLNE